MKKTILSLLLMLIAALSYSQSHAQRAAMTHARMTQQMNHNFHMMTLNAGRLSSRNVKKNVKYINKRLKSNSKTIIKYDKKLLKLEDKLQAAETSNTKKQERLKNKINIYQNAIDGIKKDNTELKSLLQEQKELIVKKEAEKQAKRDRRKKKE